MNYSTPIGSAPPKPIGPVDFRSLPCNESKTVRSSTNGKRVTSPRPGSDMPLDAARTALESGPLCDPCLGRLFADRSFGLTNAERGRALRTTVSITDDDPFEAPDPEACWVCDGECARYDVWAERAVDVLSGVEFESYQVGTRVPPLIEENDLLLRAECGLADDAGELFKSEYNREVGKRLGKATGTDVDFERPDVLCLLVIERETVELQVNPAFVYGRYRKLERNIPQTEWPCSACGATGKELAPDGGERDCRECGGSGYRYDDSVEGLTAPIVSDAMDGTEGVFHGAGREDVDAKALGTGRPFVLEVKHPRVRAVDASAIEERINDSTDRIAIDGLRRAAHTMVERVKELDASKTYALTVAFDEPVSQADLDAACESLVGTTIEQRTPRRVDHRRADLLRTREVYSLIGTLDSDRSDSASGTRATLEIDCAGGLYVKELAHGDDGRTEPSLAGELGVGIEIDHLDVLSVEGEDEPFERPEYFLD
jgi:tRNA pseudouridine synthase 10